MLIESKRHEELSANGFHHRQSTRSYKFNNARSARRTRLCWLKPILTLGRPKKIALGWKRSVRISPS